MTEFCLKPETAFALLDELSRHRALEPHETDLMEDIIAVLNPNEPEFKWNPRLENQLLIAASSKGGVKRFAQRHGIASVERCYVKLHRLRQRKVCKAARDGKMG